MKYFFFLSSLLGFVPMTAQTHSDCATALVICNKNTLQIDGVDGSGSNSQELNQASCFFNGGLTVYESNSYWIKFKAAQAGVLYFVITPNLAIDDLDFVVFRLGDAGNCQQKYLLRCMAAGETLGANSSPCAGPTGLLPGETDTLAMAGCSEPNENNFLAPLNLQTDSTYVLCIQNFTSLNGFSVKFCGTALLGCETDACFDISATSAPDHHGIQLYGIFPNPVSAATVGLDLESIEPGLMTVTLVNALGQPVRSSIHSVSSGRQTLEIPVVDLPTGLYFLQAQTPGNRYAVEKFVKQ